MEPLSNLQPVIGLALGSVYSVDVFLVYEQFDGHS